MDPDSLWVEPALYSVRFFLQSLHPTNVQEWVLVLLYPAVVWDFVVPQLLSFSKRAGCVICAECVVIKPQQQTDDALRKMGQASAAASGTKTGAAKAPTGESD
jgi:hypothetical protein